MPGTPTERWLLWWRSKSYLPSFIHIVGFDAGRRHLAEVEGRGGAVGGAVDDEAAAADVAGGGMGDGQREGGGDRAVDGVAALAHHLPADLRGDVALRHHHRPAGARRLAAGLERERDAWRRRSATTGATRRRECIG